MINFVAEVGCNHLGSIALAKEHIDVFSTFSNVKYIKFQKRTLKDLLTKEEYDAPHPNPMYAHGETYGKHREALELTIEQHIELARYCENKNVTYACSAWDIGSAKDLLNNIPKIAYIKIPSASNLNFTLIKYIIDNSACGIHISLGMTDSSEVYSILNFLAINNAEKRTVMYACTSGYPVDFKDLCLKEISNLKELCGSQFAGIGYSGHHLGIAMDIAAATLGATWIERHIVTCRSTIKHTDAPASLEPDGARKLVRDLDALEKALTYKNYMPEIEQIQRAKLKRNA